VLATGAPVCSGRLQRVAVATLVGMLSAPAVSMAMTAKYQVPEDRLLMVVVVAVGLLMLTDWLSAVADVP